MKKPFLHMKKQIIGNKKPGFEAWLFALHVVLAGLAGSAVFPAAAQCLEQID
jgi:hypothetical protein